MFSIVKSWVLTFCAFAGYGYWYNAVTGESAWAEDGA